MIVRSSPQAISAQELAQKTEADQQLIGVFHSPHQNLDVHLTLCWVETVRLMRVLAAMGLCEEAEIDSQSEAYLGNAKTKILIEEQGVYSFKTWSASFHGHEMRATDSLNEKGLIWQCLQPQNFPNISASMVTQTHGIHPNPPSHLLLVRSSGVS